MLAFARAQGFSLLEESVNWNIALTAWRPGPPDKHVLPVTGENYAAFRALWTDTNMYWNADCIEAALERWLLFVMDDGSGAAACMVYDAGVEIFGFEYCGGYHEGTHRALMTACLNAAKQRGGTSLTYFSDREEAAVLQSLGFRRVSDYCCYEMKL